MNHSQRDDYLDRSDDLVARVRAAKEAAQRKMEEFGDPSEYDITIIRGRKKEEPQSETIQDTAVPQPSFDFAKVDTANSEKKSPRNSAKNERTDVGPDFTSNEATDATRHEVD